ncbi:MAG: hypothetical protein A2W99_00155 [Bacteroidetes bacterium GWF2_33_16]|nr:MAG: hypothetical protein A2X00_02860 [Bacteroidetes bacterium GWE2_32_14]OFY08687.1 MAG: hypothetical protein A2W99_00155 [Bacteroidetes bacterium GWF2_33_16]
MEVVKDFFNNYFVLTWIGSIIGHILSLYKPEFRQSLPFLRQILPGKSDAFYFRVDFIILPLIGAFLGYYLISPGKVENAIFTGLTWSGTLIAMFKTESKTTIPEKP